MHKMKSNKENVKVSEDKEKRSHYSELPDTEESSPSKVTKKESRKGNKENREIRILRRSKTLKERNDPDRFSGDGINFKAKIIGTERVLDARGNRMCQGALQRLKAAVKTSGDHKQRIILNISLNGIMIKDEKSGELLHHHPIHKISFISQDTSDNRAFGYVFGSPQTGHEFFGIKTEKIASQVVLTLRDLFLTALELKKKELEGHKEEAAQSPTFQAQTMSNGVAATPVENGAQKPSSDHLYSNIVSLPDESSTENGKENFSSTVSAVDTLLDLQFTMDSLEQGISQMDHSIASAASQALSEDDVSESSPTSFHFKLDKLSSLYHETLSMSSRSSSTSDYNMCLPESRIEDSELPKRNLSASISSDHSIGATSIENECNLPNPCALSTTSGQSSTTSDQTSEISQPVEDRYAVFLDIDALPSIFDHPEIVQTTVVAKEEEEDYAPEIPKDEDALSNEIKTSTPLVFAELDPLGNQPYVDKKDFFQDLKNPPKKILKDLVGGVDPFPVTIADEGDDSFSSAPAVLAGNSGDLPPQVPLNPFAGNKFAGRPPPSLPPKKAAAPCPLDSLRDLGEGGSWEVKNPFNPFVMGDYPDVPPPSSPPPPPPPRLPTLSPPPPPRPPSRSTPTHPLPKRKSPFATSAQSWFSFDHEALSASRSGSIGEPEFDGFAPPLPSPARKFPNDPVLLKMSSASSSPVSPRRSSNRSPVGDAVSVTSSPGKVLSRHASLSQDSEAFVNTSMGCPKGSPPLPPKPVYRLRPPVSQASLSGSSGSAVESSNGPHSSSSLVFSSSDDGRAGSSMEALFVNSAEHPDVFAVQNGSSTELSPDSIFRRKSDPFADDFFLSLPKKSAEDSSQHANGLDKLKPST